MEITRGAASIAAAVCLIAGAGGAYLVTRNDPASKLAVASAQEPTASRSPISPDAASAGAVPPEAVSPGAVSPDPAPVEQSEAIVSDQPASGPDAPARTREQASAVRAQRRVRPAAGERVRREAPARAASARSAETPDDYVASASTPEPRIASLPTLAPSLPAPEPIAPPAPQFEDLVVTADSVIGLEVESSLTSERARVEDEVTARVTRDVKVGERVAIPAGAQAIGEVTLVERGGRMRDKARLGVRFTSIVLADGTRIPLETETVIREGSSPANESTAKIGGGAIGGAIIGGILGGAKGAIIGGSAGAGAGTAAVMAGGRNAATLTSGSPLTVRLLKPATVTIEK
jgi:type IV secretory pathway VirB10-like protein